MTCTLYSRSIGWVPVDLVVKETATDNIDVASHPIEGGAEVSDHAWVKPRELTISGAISGGSMAGYEALHRLQTTLEPFDIVSGFSVYSNMLLKTLSATREAKSGQICSFEAKCQEVIIVSTEESQGNTDGNDRTASTVNRGQVQNRPVPIPPRIPPGLRSPEGQINV